MQRAFNESSSVRVFRRRARQHNDLVSLAAPVLEVVLRVRAQLDTPSSAALRDKVDGLITDLEQQGATLRYSPEQVQAVKFALAAFVDETVLNPASPIRDEWEKLALQLKYFGDQHAGIKFFERLEELLRQPEQNAEAIEVYYLCMVFGFKGRYNIFYEDQLQDVIADTERRLREVGRLQADNLSPHWRRDDQPPLARDPGLPRWVKIGAGVLLAATLLLFFILKFVLESNAMDAQQQLLR